jgi:hypothetical protein
VRTVNALRKEAEPKKYFMNQKLNKDRQQGYCLLRSAFTLLCRPVLGLIA